MLIQIFSKVYRGNIPLLAGPKAECEPVYRKGQRQSFCWLTSTAVFHVFRFRLIGRIAPVVVDTSIDEILYAYASIVVSVLSQPTPDRVPITDLQLEKIGWSNENSPSLDSLIGENIRKLFEGCFARDLGPAPSELQTIH